MELFSVSNIKKWAQNEYALIALGAIWTSFALVTYGVLFEPHSYKPEMLIGGAVLAVVLFLLGWVHPALYLLGAVVVGAPGIVYAHVAHYWHIGNLALRIETTLDSPSGEIKEFLTEFVLRAKFTWALGVYALIALGLGIWAWRLRKRKKVRRKLWWQIAGALALAAVIGGLGLTTTQVMGYPSIRMAGTYYSVRTRLNPVLKRNKFIQHFMSHAKPLQCNNRFTKIVYVQGESENRDFMHAYGYPAQDTPFLDSLSDKLQLRAIAPGNQTILAIPLILTSANVENWDAFYTSPSVISDLKRCGYQTFWLSNQEPIGRFADSVSSIAKEADIERYVMNLEPGRVPDGHIFKIFSPAKDIVLGRKQAFFFHLMGSHYEYTHRYPPDWALIKNPQTRIGQYINTVYYTDHILKWIFDVFKEYNESLLFIYVSDHGEVVTLQGWGHGYASPHQDEYRVPLIFWASDPSALKPLSAASHDKLVNTENLYHQIRFLVGLESSPNFSFDFKVRTPGAKPIVDYRDLPYFTHPDRP